MCCLHLINVQLGFFNTINISLIIFENLNLDIVYIRGGKPMARKN